MDTSPTIGFFIHVRPSQVETPVLHSLHTKWQAHYWKLQWNIDGLPNQM
jgi:hypothetical protein